MSWSPGSLGRCSSHLLSWASFQAACSSGLRFPGLAPLVPKHRFFARARMLAKPMAVLSQIVHRYELSMRLWTRCVPQ
eukprot:3146645-Heterocapsa_arctica.AAC.1